MTVLFVLVVPFLVFLLIPKTNKLKELKEQLSDKNLEVPLSIKEEANSYKLPFKAVSDTLNNSWIIQGMVGIAGLTYVVYYFVENGFDLNLNIVIFIFVIIGLLIHKTPLRYTIAMKRSSANISGILFQYPFYAGIMGIMKYTGLGVLIAGFMASVANIDNYAIYAFFTGGVMNFAIPSAGGEFAVVGPSILSAVAEIGKGLPAEEITRMISRASMSIAYGESLSNLLQPFFLLLVFPVMGQGIKIQARDVMGYLVLPFLMVLLIQLLVISLIPI
jgi:short-chain fatty acids transporter